MFAKPKCDVPTGILRAQVIWCNFIAQHILPMAVADHTMNLLPKLCPDSSIAKGMSSKLTKATQNIKRSLATEATHLILEYCRVSPFSLMIDKSNDKNSDKRVAILVRVFDIDCGARSRILDMPVCNIGMSEAIFNTLDEVLRYYCISIPF